MKIHDLPAARLAATLAPDELRRQYLAAGLFQPGELNLRWWEVDRTILGAAIPLATPLVLPTPPEMKATFFFERREAGIVNVGGPGAIVVDGTSYTMDPLDALYIGRGAKAVSFISKSADQPARFWMLSYPAHTAYPAKRVALSETTGMRLGAKETANERTLYKMIHAGAFPTCQVVMGVTRLDPGSVWNSMPPHTHLRRSEVYLYFDVSPENVVFHFMGQPQETRHLVVRDGEAVLSPPWSIHCGCGTANYSFVWGMGGENQEFTDMDPAPPKDLR